MSLSAPDTIVSGADDVRQCIDIILKTRKGEDPLRPHFGCGLWEWLDRPNVTSIPNMKKEILEAIRLYEKRITLQRIEHEILSGGVKFRLYYKLPDGGQDVFDYNVSGASVGISPTQPLILSANYDPLSFGYFISLMLDGEVVTMPPQPSSGFDTISDLVDWVRNYWGFYGNWFWVSGQNKILLFAFSHTTGQLDITSSNVLLSAIIPDIDFQTQYYNVVFRDENNVRILPVNGQDLITYNDILDFVNNHYSGYGNWAIDGNLLKLLGNNNIQGYSLTVIAQAIGSAYSDGFDEGFY